MCRIYKLPFTKHKQAHFLFRKTCQDVRDYADKLCVSGEEALQKGMQEKAIEFVKKGSEVYQKV